METKYNYRENVLADVRQWMDDNAEYISGRFGAISEENRDDAEQWLNDEMFTSDSVTGNGSGSYTFSTWQAEENICHNLDLLAEALAEFGYDSNYVMENGAEACDVAIRCYLLYGVISAILDEYLDNFKQNSLI